MKNPARFGLACAAAATLLLSGCAGPSGAQANDTATTEVTIGVLPGVDLAPVYLGMSEGFFAEEGITLTVNSLAGSSADILAAVAAGSFDFGSADTLSALAALEDGAEIALLGAAATSTGTPRSDFAALVVRNDSEITSTAGLRGRTIGVDALGTTSELVVRHAIDAADADSGSVTWSIVPSVSASKALEDGSVDAAFMVEPFVAAAELGGFRAIAYPYAEFDSDLTVSTYVTSAAFADAEPALVDRFQAAMARSLDFAQSTPTEARNSLSGYISTYSRVGTRLVLPRFLPTISSDAVAKLAEAALGYGFLTAAPDLAVVLP